MLVLCNINFCRSGTQEETTYICELVCLDGGSDNSYESTMFQPAKQARSNIYIYN